MHIFTSRHYSLFSFKHARENMVPRPWTALGLLYNWRPGMENIQRDSCFPFDCERDDHQRQRCTQMHFVGTGQNKKYKNQRAFNWAVDGCLESNQRATSAPERKSRVTIKTAISQKSAGRWRRLAAADGSRGSGMLEALSSRLALLKPIRTHSVLHPEASHSHGNI